MASALQYDSMQIFHCPIRIYYEDTDAAGVVYHARYLHFFERARTEVLRKLGYQQNELRCQRGIIFVVRSLHIDYLYPACFDQMLNVETRILKLSGASIVFAQQLMLAEDCLSLAEVKVACVNIETSKPVAIPADLIEAMSSVS